MAEAGYKSLISYKLAQIAFDLGWDFVPKYYSEYEDSRQKEGGYNENLLRKRLAYKNHINK